MHGVRNHGLAHVGMFCIYIYCRVGVDQWILNIKLQKLPSCIVPRTLNNNLMTNGASSVLQY